MRRFLLSAAAVVIGLALVGTAQAGPKGGSGSKGGPCSLRIPWWKATWRRGPAHARR